MPTRRARRSIAAMRGTLAALLLTATVAACSSAAGEQSAGDAGAASQESEVTTVRLGFFPNVTHAPALVGLQDGLFKDSLKEEGVTVTPTAFNAGPDVVTALFAGSLDMSYIGPNPAINAYVQSKGDAVRVISGAASRGAALVVRPGIESVDDLKGKAFATPQLGNTQDVAFRYWLKEQGIETDSEGGGEVSIKPQSNSEGLAAYGSGAIDGAWVPEPWVSEYLKAGAEVLVDEVDLWPGGDFVTTHVIVRTEFLEQNPDIVAAFLEGHIDALEAIESDPAAAQRAVSASLASLTGSAPSPDILESAFKAVKFTADPQAATLTESASHAVEVGLLDSAGIEDVGGFEGLYALDLLNEVLVDAGQDPVATS